MTAMISHIRERFLTIAIGSISASLHILRQNGMLLRCWCDRLNLAAEGPPLDDNLLVDDRNANLFARSGILDRTLQVVRAQLLADGRRPGGFRRGLAAFPPGIPKVVVVARPVGAELMYTRRVEPADHEMFVVAFPVGALERNQDVRVAGEVEELRVELDIQ
jgi:hypothetical protein